MKGKIPNIFGVLMALVMALSLALVAVPAAPAVADPGTLEWTEVPVPDATGYTLYSGSDVGAIAVSPDGGAIFAASGATLANAMRSTDGGHNWKLMDTFAMPIVDIDVSDDYADDDTVVVATANATAGEVFISVDRGQTFNTWGTFTEPISSLDIGLDEDGNLVAVVGTHYDGATPGDVYLRTLVATWADQNVDVGTTANAWDVLDVGIPTYATDEGIIAVVASMPSSTYVVTKMGTNSWGVNIADTRFVDQDGADITATRASMGFPDDYNLTAAAYGGNNVFFVGLTAATLGDVYQVTSQPVGASPLAEDLDIRGVVGVNPTETDVYSIAVSGDLADATIIAGTAKYDTAMTPTQRLIYYSTDAGTTWSYTYKSPTGGPTGANTYVAMGSTAYAGTSGTESAFSASTNSGMAWNQRGLIDTTIADINDIAASETYAADGQLFVATDNGAASYSLWLTTDEGTTWERILCNSPATAVGFDSVQLAAGGYVFAAWTAAGIVLRSHDGGTTFLSLLYAKAPMTAWKVTGPTTIYTGHADGSLWWTTDFATWDQPEESEITGAVTDIEVDTDILVGDDDGKVYLSTDAGLTVEQVGSGTVATPGANTYVAFDVEYDANNILYAGGDATGIYRFNFETSTSWALIAAGVVVSGLVSADDGTLYASDYDAGWGVARSVNPTRAIALGGPDFEWLDDSLGLATDALLEGLEVVPGSNILFAIDDDNVEVVIFTDTLTGVVTLAMPSCGSTAGDIVEGSALARVVMAWEAMTGATEYEVQIALDEDFGTLVTLTDASPAGTVIDEMLWLGTEFYWRVRVLNPLWSQWSDTCSFITVLGPGAERPSLLSPTSGTTGMCAQNVNPDGTVFQWSGLVDATNYEFQVATDAEFTAVVSGLDKTGLSALGDQTSYTSTVSLSEGSDYFWRVRALILDDEGNVVTESPWSDTGCFTTSTEVVEEVPPTPWWVWLVIAIGAVLAVAVIVLIMRTRKPV
jgi:hypothetical protein